MFLLQRRLVAKQIKDLYQRRSHHNNQEKDNQGLADGKFILALGNLPNRHIPAFGDVLVKLIVAIANAAGEGLCVIILVGN